MSRVLAGIREFFRSPHSWYERRALTLLTTVLLLLLLSVSGGAIAHLFFLLTDRAREVRQELLQRDLRDLVGRFDADERFVLEHNLPQLLTERRRLQPLLLPRQYYTGLPTTAAAFLPRHPPRNCFIQLLRADGSLTEDRFCAYLSDNRVPGRYLYINFRLRNGELVPLRPGDGKLNADAIKLTISGAHRSITWWLTFQLPPVPVRRDRYEINAFRVLDNQLERDRKIEGWAYQQAQAGGTPLLYVLSRLDFKPFLLDDRDELWPPQDWQATNFTLERRDVEDGGNRTEQIAYQQTGVAELSLAKLGTSIFNAYGTITVDGTDNGNGAGQRVVEPPLDLREKLLPGRIPIKTSGGDILWPSTPSSRSEPLPDTSLVVTVSQPWLFVEKVFWQISIYLAVLFAGGVWSWHYFRRNLLHPIVDWSRHSEDLARVRMDASVALPYAERRNEIGILAKAINDLISVVRHQAARAHEERGRQERHARQKQEEELKNRMQNMDVIGHEIRSPLQALLALHPEPSDPSRRHLERMNAALPHLLGGGSTPTAISARPIRLGEIDIGRFLSELAQNAYPQLAIADVNYLGPSAGVLCRLDDGAMEDVFTNLLNNAQRHRFANTPIVVSLFTDVDDAVIEVSNQGPRIAEDLATRIFEFGVTTTKRTRDGGMGVGLYVVNDYISRMGGTVEHRNDISGVTFTIRLPLLQPTHG